VTRADSQHEPFARSFQSPGELDAVGDVVGDALIVVDSGQRIVVFNDAAERVFGYRRDEAMGEQLGMLLPDRFRGSHRQQVQTFRSHICWRGSERRVRFDLRCGGKQTHPVGQPGTSRPRRNGYLARPNLR